MEDRIEDFIRQFQTWNRIAPYQCLFLNVRGHGIPVVLLAGKFHIILPNSDWEPFISAHDQGTVVQVILEGIRWNKLSLEIDNSIAVDGINLWKCTVAEQSSVSKNLYSALLSSYLEAMKSINATPADTDPLIKLDPSTPRG